ncbi:MAG: hypothetical protein HFJ50_00970 [Clostridia bacterium]|jgi:hypothetical protein|nr:hypothetical protein [Clostridia bacterium]
MKVQAIIASLIVLIVISLNVITQKYTENAMNDILESLAHVRENLIQDKEDELKMRN